MTILHLGVIDIPYSVRARRRGKKVASGNQTTGDVAGWIEDKYGVVGHFVEAKHEVIGDALANDVAGSLETMMMGGPPKLHFGTATGIIDQTFRTFLATREVETLGIAGLPTDAALRGISHRFKGKRGQRRPSLIDTGLYQSSFRSWVDDNEPT